MSAAALLRETGGNGGKNRLHPFKHLHVVQIMTGNYNSVYLVI